MPAIDANTKLLLHFNGNFTDSSASTRTTTAISSCTTSVTQQRFGTASLYLPGTGPYITLPDSADWAFGTSAFTIDFWIYPNGNFTQKIFSQGTFAGGNKYNILYLATADHGTGNIYFTSHDTGAYVFEIIANNLTGLHDYTWYHIALVRIDGGNSSASWRIYVNGVSQTLSLLSGAWNGSIIDVADVASIGYFVDYAGCYIDEFRISNVARWSSDFTPRRAAYGIAIPTTVASIM
jgi:hypothetical protein